mgnify:CR=1 FL=1
MTGPSATGLRPITPGRQNFPAPACGGGASGPGRMAEPEEIVGAVLFLCSDDAGYITGETIACDGGWIANSDFSGIPTSKIEGWKDEFHR